LDAKGRVLEINLTGAAMMRRERAAIIGLSLLSFVHLEDPALFWKHLALCSELREPVATVMRLSPRQNDPRTIQVLSTPVLDAAGRAVAFRTCFADISGLRKFEPVTVP
jgi:hypothetical protein